MHELQPRDSPIFEREEKDWEISLGSMVGSFVLWPSLSSPWSGSRITKDHGNQRDDRRKNAGVHNFFQIKEMLKEDIEKQLWHFLEKKLQSFVSMVSQIQKTQEFETIGKDRRKTRTPGMRFFFLLILPRTIARERIRRKITNVESHACVFPDQFPYITFISLTVAPNNQDKQK